LSLIPLKGKKGSDVKEWKQNDRLVLVCAILASGLILFFNLGTKSLENHGYTRYAEVAREMIRSGEWVVPHYNGEVYLDKPPLLFWLIAIPASLHGSVTPFIALLPSALAAWIGVIFVFFWARRVYGSDKAGLISAGILLSAHQYFFEARLAKTDILLCLFILLSLYFFHLGYRDPGRRRYLFVGLSFFSMGLGILTKGPFGFFIPILVIAVFLIKERRWKVWISKPFLLGYAILVPVVLPWVILFIERVGFHETIKLVRETQILSRYAPFYFYFIQIWGEFAPWSVLFPFLFFYLWKERNQLWHSEESLFLIWFIVLFILLTLFKYRAPRYLLPVLPPLAFMIGGRWKKKMTFFLIPFFLFIMIWHGIEYYWIGKDDAYSPGMVLVRELRPFLRESALSGYQLDVSTVEEINFYLDPVLPIPILEAAKNPGEQLKKNGKGLILMPKGVYEELRARGDHSLAFVQEFRYKKGELVLISP
jgi:4-amino-4-deoxy-L-arabinose transferase-like glycosyltransferase